MNILFLITVVVAVASAAPVALQLRRQPRALITLFFAEMSERFAYYGMRALLIFFLTQQLLFDDRYSERLYGEYTSLIYLVPLAGGFLADRWLGTRKAVSFGALLLVAGYFLIAIQGPPPTQVLSYDGVDYKFEVTGRFEQRSVRLVVGNGRYEVDTADNGDLAIKNLPPTSPLPPVVAAGAYKVTLKGSSDIFIGVFQIALAFIILGIGFFKPNISALVGQIYESDDPRRDSGFTLYYYGINVGAFWATVICGWLSTAVDWYVGFGAAALGMAAGAFVFQRGRPLLAGKGEPPNPQQLTAKRFAALNAEWMIYLGALAGIVAVYFLIQHYEWAGYVLGAASISVVGYLTRFMVTKCTRTERERLMLALVLIAASVVFFTLLNLTGSSLNQFAERNTDLRIGGETIGGAQVQALNPFYLALFAPAFAALWAFLGRRGKDLDPVVKFGLALLQVGAGFLVLAWGAQIHDAAFKVPFIVIALAYLLHSTGELCLSPVGLSQMTKLAPAAVVSTVMATWFLASSWAQFLAGPLAMWFATEPVAGEIQGPAAALADNILVFRVAGIIGLGIGVLLFLLGPVLKPWAHQGESPVNAIGPKIISQPSQSPRPKPAAGILAGPALFVSHVTEDARAAQEIISELERRGIRCWVASRDVRAGRPYDDEIVHAIESCRAMLLIFSDHCNESEYIRREVTVAGECHKLVIPFRIEDVQPKHGLRVRLSDLHWIDGFVAREGALDAVERTLVNTPG
jgi:POT family proton-dependent oligopeptide transporter